MRGPYDPRVTITLNGEPRDLPDGASVADLLRDLNLPAQSVAVEVNRRLRRQPDYERPLADGDAVEVVTFVGGGA